MPKSNLCLLVPTAYYQLRGDAGHGIQDPRNLNSTSDFAPVGPISTLVTTFPADWQKKPVG